MFVDIFAMILHIYQFPPLISQLGVMTYTDITAQSPETQAAVEHEIRVLLKVCVSFFRAAEQTNKKNLYKTSF